MIDLEINFQRNWPNLKRKYGLLGLILIALAITCIILGLTISIYFFYNLLGQYELLQEGENINLNAIGSTGDFIGGLVGTIWSLAGVLLFFLALRLQSKEISLQIQELKETKSVFISQQFESTFFNLLKVQQDIRNNLQESYYNLEENVEHQDSEPSELDFFEVLSNELFDSYNQITEIVSQASKANSKIVSEIQEVMESEEINKFAYIDSEEKRARVAYYMVFDAFHNQLGHYFRHLYHILDFIEQKEDQETFSVAWNQIKGDYKDAKLKINGKSSEEEIIRKRYKKFINLLQAQMSSAELFLLFYNGICFKKMKKLILRYNFLENLSKDDLLNSEHNIFYAEQSIDGNRYDGVKFKNNSSILLQNLE